MVTILIGTLLGFLSGMGIGGGSLLLLWLTLVMQTDPYTARQINLLFFLPAAGVACYYRIKQGKLTFNKTILPVVAGCLGALVGTGISGIFRTALLKKILGALLLFCGVRELLWKPSQPNT